MEEQHRCNSIVLEMQNSTKQSSKCHLRCHDQVLRRTLEMNRFLSRGSRDLGDMQLGRRIYCKGRSKGLEW